jgi:hypothetical protein
MVMPLVTANERGGNLPVGDPGVAEPAHHADVGSPASARAVLEDHLGKERLIERDAGCGKTCRIRRMRVNYCPDIVTFPVHEQVHT